MKGSEEEKDVVMCKSAKLSRQCAEGMIRRTIVTRDKDTILQL